MPIAGKSNEIPALPPLLRSLPPLEGTLITADALHSDALHCQQESARVITQEPGGDSLFGLKGNQSGVLERAERLLTQQAFPPEADMAWEKGHHRLDRRRLQRGTVTPEQIGLCGCWQVIAVRRERVELGRKAGPPENHRQVAKLHKPLPTRGSVGGPAFPRADQPARQPAGAGDADRVVLAADAVPARPPGGGQVVAGAGGPEDHRGQTQPDRRGHRAAVQRGLVADANEPRFRPHGGIEARSAGRVCLASDGPVHPTSWAHAARRVSPRAGK